MVTDSTVAKAIINKGHCKNGYVMHHLRQMFWTLVTNNIRVRAIHVPGSLNNIPDAISRLTETGQWLMLRSLLRLWHHGHVLLQFRALCCAHMSDLALQVVAERVRDRDCGIR